MKNKLIIGIGVLSSIAFFSFKSNSDNSTKSFSEEKEYCMWIREAGKNWYVCSSKARSPQDAVDKTKKLYKNAKVTRSSDSNCKCNK